MDSRSLRFADEVIQATEGRGVDIVLNSLAGEFIAKSLSVLAPGGKFLEVGKIGVWTEKQAKEFQPDCAYFLFDLIQTADTDPSGIRHTLRALVDEFDRGVLKPLPCHVYPIEDAVSAFRTMSEAKHVGKIVISQNEAKAATSSVRDENLFRPDASYLVTGGFGALGLLTSRWMVEHGARCLALAGRNDPSGEARRAMAKLERMGAHVLALRGDVSSEGDVEKILAEIGRTLPPLHGVIHCAGCARRRRLDPTGLGSLRAGDGAQSGRHMELARAHSRSTSGILRSFFVVGFCVGLARSGKLRGRECVYGRSGPLPKGSGIAGAQRQLGALVRDRRGGPRRSRPALGIERYR